MSGLIGIDWGTSSLRAYWLDEQGAIRDSRSRPWGLRHLPEGGFDAALADITTGWPALPLLACGMVGSRQGWREAAYIELPANAGHMAGALQSVQTSNGSLLYIVPGLHNPEGPDVMRGEETQLIGALARQPGLAESSTWLLPGTHSKWASVREGAIADFSTLMTGELFALLRQHSILATGIGEAAADGDAFARGVLRARDSGGAGALSQLFSARALMLDGALAPASVPDYLSGLLLGEEFRAIQASGRYRLDTTVQLIGDSALCSRYRAAAAHFDIALSEPWLDAAAHGLWLIACSNGLVSSH